MKKFADRVIFGDVYTVDEKNPAAQAVAIADGKFVYVGDADGAENFVGAGTKVERYEDSLILPGLVDGHAHGNLGGSKMLLMCKLNDCKTLDEIRQRLKNFIAEHPEMDKIQGMGWDDATFGVSGPTAAMIDDLTDKPVAMIDYGHHSYWLNSAAMKIKNITKDTPDIADGVIVRDADGNPTGCFREGTKIYFDDLLYHFTVDQYKQALLAYQKSFLELGLTMTFDPMVNYDYGSEAVMEAYHQLDVEGKLKLRVHGGYQVFVDQNPVADVENAVKLREKFKGDRFAVDNIKILLDGVIESRTAYLIEPYVDSDDSYRGMLRFDLDSLSATIKKSNELDIIMHIHTIGDGAINFALNAMENAQTTPAHRTALTHLQIVKPTDIDRMAKLGVVAVTNPFWFIKEDSTYPMTVSFVGEERAKNQYPMKSFLDKGVVVTQASDYPVTQVLNPLESIQTAVMRQLAGKPETLLGDGSERVTVEQMIKAATLNGAYQFKCEDTLGSITVGKQADVVVLDSDITACEPEKISDAKVLRTMIGGEWVYTREK